MGLWKGKKGSSVFYRIENSNNAQKQGVRERVYDPSNPKTSSQAGQRMRMYPAQAVYGVLKDTIERSWQGVKYGQMTRQAYLKAALRSDIFPAVSKGDGVVVPGPYQIAKGSLGEVTATLGGDGSAQVDLQLTTLVATNNRTLSAALLAANPWLRQGDQITVVLCYTNDSAVTQFNWWVSSFYLDPDGTIEPERGLDDDGGFVPIGFNLSQTNSGLVYEPIDEEYVYAVACIVSREGTTTPLRTNAYLVVDTDALPGYYDVESRARARRSYMNPLRVQSTDWPVDPGEQGGGGSDDTYTITVNQVTTQAGGTEDPTAGGTVSGGGSYLIGERVTLTATPDGAHSFVGWYPSKADALANTNRLSAAATLIFDAGDQFQNVTTFFGKFQPQL